MLTSATSPVRSHSNRTSPLRPVVHHHTPAGGYHHHHNNRNISRNHSSPHSIVPQHVVSGGVGLSSSSRRVTPSRRNSTNGNIDVSNNKKFVVKNPSLTSPRTSPNRNIVTVNGKNNSSIIYLTATSSPLGNDGSGRDSSTSTTRRQRRSNSQEVTKKNHSITIANIAGGGGSADSESGGSGGNYSVKSFATSTPVKDADNLSPPLSQALYINKHYFQISVVAKLIYNSKCLSIRLFVRTYWKNVSLMFQVLVKINLTNEHLFYL